MQFLADENISRRVIDGLRDKGLSVVSVGEVCPGATDEEVLTLADKNGYVLITKDDDFGELVIRHKRKVSGLILLQLDRLSKTARDDRAADAIFAGVAQFDGNLVVIRPDRISVRPLSSTGTD
jgi:predicted nuclease of predicted toxin-antitoxin system